MNYKTQLLADEWKVRRLQIMIKGGFRCEDCKNPFPGGRGLEIHHCAYITGRKAWEYDDELLMPLCRACHQHRQQRQDAAMVQLGKAMRQMKTHELENAVWTFLVWTYLGPFSHLKEVCE